MIYYFKPFDLDKKLGRAYNEYMRMLPSDEDWGCLLDGDTMFLTEDYGKQIQEIVMMYPNTGLFTCLTNRVGRRQQCYKGVMSENWDIKHHYQIAQEVQKFARHNVSEIHTIISGHLLLVKKKTWREVGGFVEEGILKVDNKFSWGILQARKKILIMNGVYIFHRYRINGIKFREHLK